MRLTVVLTIILILAVTSVTELFSQSYPCTITYRNKSQMNRTRIMGVYEDLMLVHDTAYKIVNVEKVSKIFFDNGTYKWTGVGVGAGAGFLFGIISYSKFKINKTKWMPVKDVTLYSILLAIPCAVIGYFVGNAFRNTDDYDLEKLNSFTKGKEIKFIMKDHSPFR